MDSESRAQSQSSAEPRSESKILVGQKRDIMETEETSESSYKRVKLSDLESVCPSQANAKEKTMPLDLDLNAEDISSSINNDPFYPFNHSKNLQKSRNDSECESSVGPPHEKDPMTVWNGLKQNNYMSAQHGAPPMPAQKARARKKNNDVVKKKIEFVKKEHVDRFAKVAAPSGLLNGLNPGIINHVRNRKQVHSIIEALVGSERSEIRQGDEIKNCVAELMENDGRWDRFGEITKCDVENKPDGLGLKMSSCGTVGSENMSCLSAEESGNFKSVTSLSFKAANVASQWLDLLNQDIRGRLAALRRSKKRVRSVITTELPDLITREFSNNNTEKESNETKSSTLCSFDKASADAHAVRWNTLFGQMDKSLSDEESHLENWLNQVKEMQLHCENGLRNSLENASQESGPTGNHNRLGEAHNSEKDLDVSAAAASIYSTCNFLLTMENLPCC
ncbi:hypothetical protein PHJA_000805700 [Phtheirospermum japonicum]|uniref:Uncharacterized protein n=1 Tax=Phtheirospermum japonicum TaxID=374723 RepID=A0A830BM68_9LAMI|nr:hypothetical protein PHJA_000805700 [Phtheirospermum japonicum]